MKQKFKGQTLTTTKVVNNILRVYDQSTNNHNWYVEANTLAFELGKKYLPNDTEKVATAKVSGIIASLSPLKSWDENKKITITFLQGGKAKHTAVMVNKAKLILSSNGDVDVIAEILNGNKITSFFLNILQPYTSQAVTIDRHAISIAVGESLTGDQLQISTNQYKFFETCYRVAANKRNELPSQMQAVTWVKWRELKSNN